MLSVVSAGELQRRQAAKDRAAVELSQDKNPAVVDRLAHHVRQQYWVFRRHRITRAIKDRMLAAQRSYNGEYSPAKLQQIRAFGGSEVYARLTSIKCRGAAAMLSDIYLSGSRPWAIQPTPVPDVPGDVMAKIEFLIAAEVSALRAAGQEISEAMVGARRSALQKAAKEAQEKSSRERAKEAEKYIDDMMVEGGFYDAFAMFLLDLAIFPFAVIKGPVVQMDSEIEWVDGEPNEVTRPRMSWKRISPFDVYFTPSASCIEEADIIERGWLRRIDVQSLIGVPGYDEKAIRGALADYINGHYDNLDDQDTERAEGEDKENPHLNEAHTLNTLEFHGYIPGELLQTWNGGAAIRGVADFRPELDYNVVVFVLGRYCIKVQINPNPHKRHPYFATSFEKVPGALVGRALPETLDDSQHTANAALRSLVNNMAMASGPMVGRNTSRMDPSQDPAQLYPWKRFDFTSDPMGTSDPPLVFFQPKSNAAELLSIFQKMMDMADEVSGIPRYLTGNQNVGGAASTASGLNMLMNNAGKVMKLVASQIDGEVLQPALRWLYDFVLLTADTDLVQGDDTINPLGASRATKQERDLQRQLEFLQMTANPLDQEIVGPRGRATIYRELAENLGLPGEEIVPSDEKLAALEQAQAELAAQAQGAQSPAPGEADNRPNRGLDNAMRTRTQAAIARQSQP